MSCDPAKRVAVQAAPAESDSGEVHVSESGDDTVLLFDVEVISVG